MSILGHSKMIYNNTYVGETDPTLIVHKLYAADHSLEHVLFTLLMFWYLFSVNVGTMAEDFYG